MNLGPDKFIHGRLYNKKRVLFTHPDGIKDKFLILLRRETCLRHTRDHPLPQTL